MDQRYALLCRELKNLSDLEEGRRNREGILSRAASLVQTVFDARLAYAGIDHEGSGVVSVAQPGAAVVRTASWSGPGQVGRYVMQQRELRAWKEGESPAPSPEDLRGGAARAWMGAPLFRADRPAGVLVAVLDEAREFDDTDRDLLCLIAAHTSCAITNLRVFQEVESLAVTDDLTHIYNYRFMKAALAREVERASRYSQVFSILMIDVDHLKKYNERFGHLQGSALLKRLARILSERSRAIDLVAKYGGDEFLIILPQTSLDGAMAMASRLVAAVAEEPFTHCAPGDITVSIGAASFPEHGATMEALLAASDEALFRAKDDGRNCVLAATGPGQPGRIPEAA
jgi:diguanylate cyclase (GGDEF)-like protein